MAGSHVVRWTSSIPHLKGRAILGPGLALIIYPGRRNITMPQPLLHLGNVGVVG
jgi:hypothetical protein